MEPYVIPGVIAVAFGMFGLAMRNPIAGTVKKLHKKMRRPRAVKTNSEKPGR